MIVTRQRKQKKSSLPILLPIAAIVMLGVALTWPPSQRFITNGPLHPVFQVIGTVWGVVSRPLTFAYQQQQITDLNLDKKQLNDQLEADRKVAAEKDAQLAQLQKQIAAANAEPAATDAPAEGQPAAAGATGQTATGGDTGGAVASPLGIAELKRDAAQWTQMDPEKAAGLVQKLPTEYVARVFAQMSPDAVGPIMDSLPPKTAAQIVESGAGAQISASQSR